MENIVNKIINLCNSKDLVCKKIFGENDIYFVYAPPKGSSEGDTADGTFLYNDGVLKGFIPSEDFALYEELTDSDNLIWEEDNE